VSEHETPKSIDRQLRNVALPPGLLPRLREIAAMGDAELDFLIGAVPVPAETLDRLLTIGSLSESDIDGELRDVELPRGMRYRVERAMRWQAKRAQLIGWAVAASLLAVVSGAAYWASVDRNVAQHTANSPRVERRNGVEHPSDVDPSQLVMPKDQNRQEPRVETADGADPRLQSPEHVELPPNISPPNEMVQGPGPSTRASQDQPNQDGTDAPSSAPKSDPFGGPLPPVPPKMKLVQAPLARGVSGPRVEGYDILSELRWGRHPFVVPAMHVALRDSRVPIWTDTSSYELACRMVEAGRLPPPSQVHTEDFLAAMDYGFPLPASGPIGIRTAAGPAPWGPPGMSLMQIGIQAAKLPSNPASATHLTLVIDTSAAMRESGRWDLVRRALEQLTEQLGPRDRVSLVFFNAQATLRVRQANQAEIRVALSSWNDVALDGFADMAAGLELAVGGAQPLAGAKGGQESLDKIVLIADGLDPIDDRSLPRLRELLHKTIAAGVKWEMIGLGQDATLSPEWDELAEIGGHTVRHANTPDQLFQRLNETLAGQSRIVAGSVEMKVTFDPAAVSRYRLIGHELNGAGGLSGASLQEDLRSGQAATALYEVELKPDGPPDVAFVEVSWRDPVGDAPHHIRQPIGRLQFLSSWNECALPLQTAAVAALTADVLRSSNVLPTNAHVLGQVADLAAEMNPALSNRPGILRLKQLIAQAGTAKPARSGSAGAAP
jgi:Ca-activated chloride channel homolog